MSHAELPEVKGQNNYEGASCRASLTATFDSPDVFSLLTLYAAGAVIRNLSRVSALNPAATHVTVIWGEKSKVIINISSRVTEFKLGFSLTVFLKNV